MFNYLVMRPAKTQSDEGIEIELPSWEAWTVQARSPKEAVEACCDIPSIYHVYEADPVEFEVDHFTRLKATQVSAIDESDDA